MRAVWTSVVILLWAAILAIPAIGLNLPDRHLPDWPPTFVPRASICSAPGGGGVINLSTGCIQPGIGP